LTVFGEIISYLNSS